MPTPCSQLSIRGSYSKDEEPTTLTRPFLPSLWSIPTPSHLSLNPPQPTSSKQQTRFVFIPSHPCCDWCVDMRLRISSWKGRQSLPHLVIQNIPAPLRLGSTEKFGSRKTLSVGLQLTAFLHSMNGPDIHGVFLSSYPEVPPGISQLMVSRRYVMTHSRRQHPRFCWNFFQSSEHSRLSPHLFPFLSRMDQSRPHAPHASTLSPHSVAPIPPPLILPSDHTCLRPCLVL